MFYILVSSELLTVFSSLIKPLCWTRKNMICVGRNALLLNGSCFSRFFFFFFFFFFCPLSRQVDCLIHIHSVFHPPCDLSAILIYFCSLCLLLDFFYHFKSLFYWLLLYKHRRIIWLGYCETIKFIFCCVISVEDQFYSFRQFLISYIHCLFYGV